VRGNCRRSMKPLTRCSRNVARAGPVGMDVRESKVAGTLTTTIIDAVHGGPARGMLVDLFRLPGGIAERQHLKTIETDERGAVPVPLLAEEALVPATYELLFHVGRYFRAEQAPRGEAVFLDVVPVRFTVADASRSYHLALLVSPWSYTAYRG